MNPSDSETQTDMERTRHTMRILAQSMRDPALSGGCPMLGELFDILVEEKVAEPLLLAVPQWKMPGLLLSAALLFQAYGDANHPLAPWLPSVTRPRSLDATFREAACRALVENASSLITLMAKHTYQCNPPRRMASSLIAIAAATNGWDARPAIHVDIGTASGIGLLLGKMRAISGTASVGATNPEMELPIELRGAPLDLNSLKCPEIEYSAGIDLDPPDLHDPACRAWMRACQFPIAAELTAFDQAVALFLAQRSRIERGSAADILPRIVAEMPEGQPLIATDTYVSVFMSEEQREQMRCELDKIAQSRPVVWISNNPVMPLGNNPDRTTAGIPISQDLVELNRSVIFGAISATTWPNGKRTPRLLGINHPGACWLEWFGQ